MRELASLVVCLFLVMVPAAAKKGHGRGHGKGHGQAEATVFHVETRQVIVDYYRVGVSKRDGDLPPGLEKQLRRNGRLPPGLDKKLLPFPVELERRLPPLPAGAQRGLIGGRAVIYSPQRGLVLDVFAVF